MTPATRQQQRYVQLLQAIQTATQAISGQPDSPAVARWLRHRAACYRALARECPRSELAGTAGPAAEADEARADRIDPKADERRKQRP